MLRICVHVHDGVCVFDHMYVNVHESECESALYTTAPSIKQFQIIN